MDEIDELRQRLRARRGRLKRKFLGLWRSRSHWAGLALGAIVGIQPQLMDWLRYKLEPADYALAGLAIVAVIGAMRWITSKPLEEK